jgi:hypothetical protein
VREEVGALRIDGPQGVGGMAEQKDVHRPSTAVWCMVVCALASGCGCSTESEPADETEPRARSDVRTATETETASTVGVLEDAEVGYSMSYPRPWKVAGALVATEFAADADCRSVEIVDREPPPEAGPGAQVLHTLVQVCAHRLTDSASLEEFLRRTYDEEILARFRRTTVGSGRGFTTGTAVNSTTFLQTDTHRLQVVTAVVADPAERQQRIAEVEAVLQTLSLGP